MARIKQSAAVAASEVAQASNAIEAACKSVADLADAIRRGGLVIGLTTSPDEGLTIVEKFGITIRIGTP